MSYEPHNPRLVLPSTLPPYSPSPRPPAYTLAPSSSERLLEFTPGSRRQSRETFTKRDGRTSVILHDQESVGLIPSYGRHSIIDGLVFFENPSIVTGVAIKLEGNLDIVVPSVVPYCQKIVNQTRVLYSRATHGPCQNTLPFALPFPTTFSEGDRRFSSPPSFEMLYLVEAGLFAKARYQLVVVVSKEISHLSILRTKRITIPLRYYPRTRPELPSVEDPHLFRSIKSTPEDWKQVSTQLQPSEGKNLPPISVEMFIPSTQIFALSDTIPVHVQLFGTVAALRALVPRLSEDIYPTHVGSTTDSKPLLRMYIIRQLVVESLGETSRSSITIGHGVLTPLPPPASGSHSEDFQLDWKGEVKCNSDVSVGSFGTVCLVVKDYILLTISPSDAKLVSYGKLQIAVPIRIVTDAWSPGAYAV